MWKKLKQKMGSGFFNAWWKLKAAPIESLMGSQNFQS
jgi:hypothetical protein